MIVRIYLFDVAFWIIFCYLLILITGIKEAIYVGQGGLLFYSLNLVKEVILNGINSRVLSR